MNYNVGELVITKTGTHVYTIQEVAQIVDEGTIFLIFGKNENDQGDDYEYALICQETGDISMWPTHTLNSCFDKL